MNLEKQPGGVVRVTRFILKPMLDGL